MIAMTLLRPVIPTHQPDLPEKKLLSFSCAFFTNSHSIQNTFSFSLPPATKLMMNRGFDASLNGYFNFLLTNAV